MLALVTENPISYYFIRPRQQDAIEPKKYYNVDSLRAWTVLYNPGVYISTALNLSNLSPPSDPPYELDMRQRRGKSLHQFMGEVYLVRMRLWFFLRGCNNGKYLFLSQGRRASLTFYLPVQKGIWARRRCSSSISHTICIHSHYPPSDSVRTSCH